MAEEINRQWLLRARPVGMIQESDFEYREAAVPQPGEGEVLLRNLVLSFDPAMRGWVEDRPSYMPPVGLGEVMRAGTIAQVVASRDARFREGEIVQGLFGWQDYFLASGPSVGALSPIPKDVPARWCLGVLGITGLTAYFGLLDVGEPRAGETVVVSGAAGATGSVAGQIARLKGCRVVGIAGGAEKCRWLEQQARFDASIDYKAEAVDRRLGELCPKGIDVYFDNVGGPILDAVLARIADRARVVLCGAISQYNELSPPPGPSNYFNLVIRRGRMQGFIVIDYFARFPDAVAELAAWVRAGEIVHEEDVQQGLENAPKTLLRLFRGENRGKQLLEIAEPPLEPSVPLSG